VSAPLRLADPAAALDALLALAPAPVTPCRLPAAAAVGLVLAEALVARGPVPAMPVAARDGWAVAATDTDGAGPYAPAMLPAPPHRLAPGDPLPPGTDAVLAPFELSEDGPFAAAVATVAPGEGVRRPGEEIAPGTLLRAAGQRLRARDLPALAALGIAEVALRRPRLGWIATGDEILADPRRDTLGPLLAALVPDAAFARLPPVPDDPAAIAAALRAAAPSCDLLLLGGGTGEGQGDRSAAGLRAAGTLQVHGIGARPGTTAGFGAVAGRPVLLLPGRAEDALAAWILLGRPLLARLAGAALPPPLRARLARKVASTVGLAELVPVRLEAGIAEPLAVGAVPLSALSAADAMLVVPPGAEGHDAGTEVDLVPL
jgi:molybdenum cofactor synthesis domain-containing protein